ncbi:recombinase family protein [Gordonia hongkongensis]|uniref:recombinase family protein n=1 Tax=Gordonia hongkongensis TaxID=1701090 RepID=UPI001FF73389|nr:recombinase family protein [Gordonia hongkongensis]UPG68788.1 recombinase family protein [Gordonia hongkongensis]
MPERIAVIYCRISQDRTGLRAGVDRQRADCERLAESLGWTVGDVFVDNDVSAYGRRPRPEYQRMLDLLRDGRVGALIAWHTDRLYRSIPDLSELVEICDDRGIEIRTCKAGEVDLSTPSGRLSATMFASIARYEVERSAERLRSAKDQQAREGKFRGGPRPFGYQDGGLQLDETEAARLREAADHLLSGGSLMAVTRRWNSEGFTTARGSKWTVTALRKVLTRGRNAGLVEQQGRVVGPALWPAIFDEDTLHAIRAVVSDPTRRTATSYEKKHQGAGIYRCGKCDAPMKTIKAHGGGRDYRCAEQLHLSQKQDPLDEFVSALVVGRLSRPDAAVMFAAEPDCDPVQLARTREGIQARKDELAALFAAGTIDGSQLKRGSADLQVKLDAVDAELAAARQQSPVADLALAPDVAERWSELTADVRGKIIDALMRVTVLPVGAGAKRRDFHVSERVSVEWKR